MGYAFTELFDIPQLTELCESFTRTNGVVTALLDLDGKVHVQSGWQDICTKFHRVNPVSSKRCTESDTALANRLAEGETYNVYQCKNGLVDIAVPIYVDNQHVANFFTGQFLFKKPDNDYFKQQANELGFELIPYIDALNQVPIFDEQKIKTIMAFLVQLAEFVGEMGKAKLDISRLRELDQQRIKDLKAKNEELEAAKKQLEKLASEDPLTGAYNRRKFGDLLTQEYYRYQRYGSPMCVAIIDVDLFKSINDSHGHEVGDSVLRCVAEHLKSGLRQSDVIARIGGDEFAVLLPESSGENVIGTFTKVSAELAALEFDGDEGPFTISCSIGVACIDHRCQSTNDIMRHADQAMYRAKNAGRNQTVLYDAEQMASTP